MLSRTASSLRISAAVARQAAAPLSTLAAAHQQQGQQGQQGQRSHSSSSSKLGLGLAVGSGAAYFHSSAVMGAAAAEPATPSSSSSSSSAAFLPPFNLDHFRDFGSLEAFKTQQDIVLYQYETCPFCNKVRAYLDSQGIRYRVVEVNPLTKEEKKAGGRLVAKIKEVPILTINGDVLVDSTPIIKNVNSIMNLYRKEGEKKNIDQEEEASLSFVDSRIVPLTAPNIYRSFKESLDSFEYISKNSQLAANSGAFKQFYTKWVGATVMYALSELKLKKKYNIDDPRASLYQALSEFIGGNKGARFRGGAEPNLADITCFGVMRALQGYQAGADIMNPNNTSKEFVQWYKDMEQKVNAAAVPHRQ